MQYSMSSVLFIFSGSVSSFAGAGGVLFCFFVRDRDVWPLFVGPKTTDCRAHPNKISRGMSIKNGIKLFNFFWNKITPF